MKTSGVATATSTEDVTSNACAADAATFEGSSDAAPTTPTIRWKARSATEAKQFVRQMHRRVPAWKLKLCTEALHASPVDLARIAEVTEIQFEMIDVAVQCLSEIAEEIESASASAGSPGNTAAAPSHDDKESTNDKSTSPESEKESKTPAEGLADTDDSHKAATDQCATAQGSSQSTSTPAVQSQESVTRCYSTA